MTSNIVMNDETIQKLEEKFEHCFELESKFMNSDEYKELFSKAKMVYPNEYEYLIHLACISYFEDKLKIIES